MLYFFIRPAKMKLVNSRLMAAFRRDNMVAGHLREKNGIWQMVIELKDSNGNRKTKSISTKLPVKGNKRKAEQLLLETREKYSITADEKDAQEDILFSDFIMKWLAVTKDNIRESTYSNYYNNIHRRIAPYFQKQGIYLKDLKPSDIQEYYAYLKKTRHVKNKTIIIQHSNINLALNYAVVNDLITENPAKKVKLPKKEKYIAAVYNEEEVTQLFKAIKGDPIELAIILGAYYGLRREEILGLKWNAIDFNNNTITIQHTVTRCTIEGKSTVLANNSTKSKASYRVLPMTEALKRLLMDKYNSQKYLMKVCMEAYNWQYKDYVNVDKQGNLLKPDYLTQHFALILKKYELKKIRFHDLRHTCASLLYSKKIDIKRIQEWLGHEDISTTMNIYTHLAYHTKEESAEVIETLMNDTFNV